MVIKDNRGQAMTAEAVLAAFIIASSLTFAFSIMIINDGSLGHGRDVQKEVANSELATSLLETSDEEEILKPTILYWNETEGSYHDTSTSKIYYTTKQPPTEFGTLIENTFNTSEVTINIEILYWEDTDGDGTLEHQTQKLVWHENPPESATTAQYTTTLYDSDTLKNSDGSDSSTTLAESSSFYIPDASGNELYNTVTVRVIIWEE